MPADPPSTVAVAPNSTESHARRRTILLVVLVVWALISTGILGWLVLNPSGPSQSEIWAADVNTLGHLRQDFGLIALDTEEYLSTNDTNWRLNALDWAFLAYYDVRDAVSARGGFPSGQPLGINTTAMCVAANGYSFITMGGIWYPGPHQDVATVLGTYENLSARLSSLAAGRDPLTSIGASNVTAVHTLMTALWNMYMNPDLGQGSTITDACGIF